MHLDAKPVCLTVFWNLSSVFTVKSRQINVFFGATKLFKQFLFHFQELLLCDKKISAFTHEPVTPHDAKLASTCSMLSVESRENKT